MNRHSVLVGLLVACGPGDRDRTTTVDAGVDSVRGDAAAMVCYASATEVDVELMVQIEESCAVWNSLADLSGRATVTRTGTSLAIDFGSGVTFSGTLINNAVSLHYDHQHPFSDGCGWKASETLVGQLDPANCAFALSYDYVESVVTSDGTCDSPCSAMANVQLDLTPVIL
jgi:hypothetical protein